MINILNPVEINDFKKNLTRLVVSFIFYALRIKGQLHLVLTLFISCKIITVLGI